MSTNDPGCTLMKCEDFKDGVCHYEKPWCKFRPPEDAEVVELIKEAENRGRREGFVAFAKDIINWPSWMSEAEVQCLEADAFKKAAEDEAARRWPEVKP